MNPFRLALAALVLFTSTPIPAQMPELKLEGQLNTPSSQNRRALGHAVSASRGGRGGRRAGCSVERGGGRSRAHFRRHHREYDGRRLGPHPVGRYPARPSRSASSSTKITTVNTIKQQEYLQRVRALIEERDEQVLKNTLTIEKLRAEFAPLEQEQKKLRIRGQMEDEKTIQAASALRYQRNRARLENDIVKEKLAAERIKADADKLRRELVVAELDFQARKLRQEADLADNRTVAIKADLELRDKKEIWKKQANREPDYEKNPFKDGVLTISDRRIPIAGPTSTAPRIS